MIKAVADFPVICAVLDYSRLESETSSVAVQLRFKGYQLKAGQSQSLTVRPELRACRAVEGWTVKPFMVRSFDKLRTHHERP